MPRPQGVPEGYGTCPKCSGTFRRCDCTWEQADEAYLRRQQNKAKAGKSNGDIVKTVIVDGVNLYLWKDGRVTWGS